MNPEPVVAFTPGHPQQFRDLLQRRAIELGPTAFDAHRSLLASAIAELETSVDGISIGTCLILGWMYMVAGRPLATASAYARAIAFPVPDRINSEERAQLLELRDAVAEGNPSLAGDLDDGIRILRLGCAVAHRQRSAIDQHLSELDAQRLSGEEYGRGPIAILVGGASSELDEWLRQTYGALLRDALSDLRGFVISGGTTTGIPGLVGDIARADAGRTYRLVGYIPSVLPPNAMVADVYHNYRTDGQSFSQREPIQYWTDIVASGGDPEDVRILGINGGRIAAFEYRLGLAMGARVGIVRGSGRAADELLSKESWRSSSHPTPLAAETRSLVEFLHPRQ